MSNKFTQSTNSRISYIEDGSVVVNTNPYPLVSTAKIDLTAIYLNLGFDLLAARAMAEADLGLAAEEQKDHDEDQRGDYR